MLSSQDLPSDFSVLCEFAVLLRGCAALLTFPLLHAAARRCASHHPLIITLHSAWGAPVRPVRQLYHPFLQCLHSTASRLISLACAGVAVAGGDAVATGRLQSLRGIIRDRKRKGRRQQHRPAVVLDGLAARRRQAAEGARCCLDCTSQGCRHCVDAAGKAHTVLHCRQGPTELAVAARVHSRSGGGSGLAAGTSNRHETCRCQLGTPACRRWTW